MIWFVCWQIDPQRKRQVDVDELVVGLVDLDADDTLVDLHRIRAQVHSDRRAFAFTGSVVETPIVLGAFDDVVHHQTIGEQ